MRTITHNKPVRDLAVAVAKDPDELLTIDAAAAELRVTHWTIRKYMSRGLLPRRKVGGIGRAHRTVVRRGDLIALVQVE